MASPSVGELAVPIAVLLIVIALITPLPSFMLDILIVLDLMMSVIVMMVAMYIGRPVEFSVFPTMLLLLTLFRLALNVSSSRLILLNGNTGTSAAGHVIEAFGSFVVGGNYIIGAVIFCVLIAIQYVVINHGAVRISEVTARFTLDALPGKQMSIDADLNGGLIDETEARRRRSDLSSEAEFYGAMDGASRFTQRDAVASIIITGINIVAGFLIGVLQHDMDLGHAIQTYTVLTIGDGLVTVIPALMISISGGLIVTRASSDSKLGAQFQKQVFGKSEPLLLASGVLVALSLFPGLPTIPFLALGGGLGAIGWRMRRKNDAAVKTSTESAEKPAKENLEALLQVDPLTVEVGLGLVKLVEGGANSPLLQRIAGIRKNLATQLGYYLPPVKVNDNLSLRSREYALLIKGVEMGRFEMPAGQELAIPSAGADGSMEGKPTKDPAFQSGGSLDSRRTRRAGAQQGLHGGRRRQRDGHASLRSGPPPRPRTLQPAGHQELLRPGGAKQSESGGGFGSKNALAFGDPTSASESAAGAGADPRLRHDPGGSQRRSADDQEPGVAHRIRAAVHSPGHRQFACDAAR